MPPLSDWKDWAGAQPCDGLFVKEAAVGGPCNRCTDIYCDPSPTAAGAGTSAVATAVGGAAPAALDAAQQVLELWLAIISKAGAILDKIKARLNIQERAYCLAATWTDPMRQVRSGGTALAADARHACFVCEARCWLGKPDAAPPAWHPMQINCVFGFVLAEIAKATTAKCGCMPGCRAAVPAPNAAPPAPLGMPAL